MTAYVIAQLKFVNREKYDSYTTRFAAVFKKFRGTVLVSDENVKVIEGTWERDKLVVISFPDEESAFEFMASSEYQEIAIDRKAGADGIVLLATGNGG